MDHLLANRMNNSHKSFIREILKVTQSPEMISFAGGLPNPDLFPVGKISKAAEKVLCDSGKEVLQYTTTEGFYPLRELIAKRYWEKKGLKVEPEEILITNGSQQGLDLISKVFLEKGDSIIIEKPGYLGAIQVFTLFEPVFHPIQLNPDGLDTEMLENCLEKTKVKFIYTIPNFQNPSGICYSDDKRREIAGILSRREVLSIEDDAYGELRFKGKDLPSIKNYMGDKAVLLGSFSKIISPGLRIGWICADKALIEKLVLVKQASDLHTNYFSQKIIYQMMVDHNIDTHIQCIKEAYQRQRDVMMSAIKLHFPEEVKIVLPEGGMFLWALLPESISSMDLFHIALNENVAFVPGSAFYIDGTGNNTLRLNFSNMESNKIEEGIIRLAKSIKKLLYGGL